MKHFGIFIADLESERFLTASNDQIATWLFLHAFCSKQTNGGTIKNASTLPERFWNHHGITAGIIANPSPLWSWNESDLSVHPYDIGGEELYLKKVKGGKLGNEKRWNRSDNRTPNRTPNPPNLTLPNLTRPDLREETESLFKESHSPKRREDIGTLEELKAYAVELGLPESDGESMFLKWDENGWRNKSRKIQSWRKTMKRWKHEGWMPSQKAPSRPESHEALQAHAASLGISDEVATAYWDKRKGVGWKIGNQPIADWESDLIAFVEAWNRNLPKP